MNLSMRILAAFVVSILSCRKAMSFLDVPSRSLLVSEEATAESISGIQVTILENTFRTIFKYFHQCKAKERK
jgi:hypothetical protein